MGIEAETNAATFLTATTSIELPEMPKRQLADRILDEIVALGVRGRWWWRWTKIR